MCGSVLCTPSVACIPHIPQKFASSGTSDSQFEQISDSTTSEFEVTCSSLESHSSCRAQSPRDISSKNTAKLTGVKRWLTVFLLLVDGQCHDSSQHLDSERTALAVCQRWHSPWSWKPL